MQQASVKNNHKWMYIKIYLLQTWLSTEIATTEHKVSKAFSTTSNQWCNKTACLICLSVGIKQAN